VRAGSAIDRIRRHLPRAELCAELHEGFTSRSYRVRAGGRELVMRVDEPLATRLSLDRSLEAQIMRIAAQAGLSPEVVALDPQPPAILVRDFVAGRAWDRSDFRDPERVGRLTALLRSVHELPTGLMGGRGRLEQSIGSYIELLGTDSRALGEQGLALLRQLEASSPAPECLCHRDPTGGNVLEDLSGRLWLNDWEYSGPGEPLFDAAVLATELERAGNAYVETPAVAGLGARLAEFRRLYALILVLWLRLIDRERGLTGDQQRELRESERVLARGQ
jgi:thiamine kinase-like enzyme